MKAHIAKLADAKPSNLQLRKLAATAGPFWLPTIPYTIVDAVNRCAAATGSVRYAMLSADASYNGHGIRVSYNGFRDYCICEHWFGGRVVHARGSMGDVLRAGRNEYDRGARGTSVTTTDLTPAEAEYALSLGYMPWTKEGETAWHNLWMDERFGEVSRALADNAAHLLVKATSLVDYMEQRERMHADQMFGAGQWREVVSVGPKGERALVCSGTHRRTGSNTVMLMVDGWSRCSGPGQLALETLKELGWSQGDAMLAVG